jgi:excinuclease UvrABC nuclease subunit
VAYFNPKTWLTPNTYDHNFAEPSGSGIYLLCQRKIWYDHSGKVRFKILYVGMSKNLRLRIEGHSVLSELRESFEDVVVFFRNYPGELRKLERDFIQKFNPPYNIIGRKRGI